LRITAQGFKTDCCRELAVCDLVRKVLGDVMIRGESVAVSCKENKVREMQVICRKPARVSTSRKAYVKDLTFNPRSAFITIRLSSSISHGTL